jgi:hypothetical protein
VPSRHHVRLVALSLLVVLGVLVTWWVFRG